MMGADRLELLERRTEALAERLARLEREIGRAPVVTRTPPKPGPEPKRSAPVTPPRPVIPPPAPKPPKREVNVEDVLGGRVLAWIGGVAVLVGIAFFFALAISHGWIGPAARTIIAGAGALALFAAGVWLHGRKGRTDAALAAVSTGVAGLFATVTVAAQVYDLVPALIGLLLAAAVGVMTTCLALRWEARGVAALGIGGSLLAPVLVGAPATSGSMAFLLIASAAAAAVLLWQRWDWLAFGAFSVSTPQWIAWLVNGPRLGAALTVLACFGVLNVAAAIGFELRMPGAALRRSAPFLLAVNALVLGTVGWFWLASNHHRTAGQIWLVALAASHLALGLSERRFARVSHEIGLLSLVLGVSLADVAYGLIVSGPALTVGWAAGAVAFAIVGKRVRGRSGDRAFAQVGLGAHVALALVRTLVADAPPSAISGGGAGVLSAAAAVSALAAACFASARLAEDGRRDWRAALDSLGLAALAYLTAILLDGPPLAIAWAVEAGALAQIARRSKDRVALVGASAFVAAAALHMLISDAPPVTIVDGAHHLVLAAGAIVAIALAAFRAARAVPTRGWRVGLDALALCAIAYLAAVALDGVMLVGAWALAAVALAEVARRTGDRVAAAGAFGFVALAGSHATMLEAPPRALVYGVHDIAAAAAAVLLVAAATLRLAQLGTAGERWRAATAVSAVLLLLYTASVALVSAFQPGTAGTELSIFDLGARQQGQALLSVLWSLVGVTALVIGLRRDLKAARIGALALLLVTVGKVFLYDLAALTSVYRVASFVGLGLLLLAAAFAWQRMRPRPLPDLRSTPRALR